MRRVTAGVVCYLVLTFGLSAVFWARISSGVPLDRVVGALMWMPAASALLTQLVCYRTIAGLGWRLGSWRYLAAAALIPIGYCAVVYVPVWFLGIGPFDARRFERILPLVPGALASSLATALGEEIGWRGFMVPALDRAGGFAWAGIGTGIVWALWHVPLIVVGGYNAGTPLWYGIPALVTSVTGMSVALAWLRLRSGSLWPAAVFHAVHNVAIQGVFDGSTVDTGWTKWVTTEFGAGLTVATAFIGWYFWRRRGELIVRPA